MDDRKGLVPKGDPVFDMSYVVASTDSIMVNINVRDFGRFIEGVKAIKDGKPCVINTWDGSKEVTVKIRCETENQPKFMGESKS